MSKRKSKPLFTMRPTLTTLEWENIRDTPRGSFAAAEGVLIAIPINVYLHTMQYTMDLQQKLRDQSLTLGEANHRTFAKCEELERVKAQANEDIKALQKDIDRLHNDIVQHRLTASRLHQAAGSLLDVIGGYDIK